MLPRTSALMLPIAYGKTRVSWPTLVPMALTRLVFLFATVTVIVDDEAVEARFGVVVVRKRVSFTRIGLPRPDSMSASNDSLSSCCQ
jgi:hypothetical protein